MMAVVLTLLLSVVAVWCMGVALIGLTKNAEARWEQKLVLWTGRILLGLACASAIAAGIGGLYSLTIGRIIQ